LDDFGIGLNAKALKVQKQRSFSVAMFQSNQGEMSVLVCKQGIEALTTNMNHEMVPSTNKQICGPQKPE
jgi:hypothetical protein